MKRLFFLLLCAFAVSLSARADVNTDKAMAKIGRDTKTYISADARASTEQEAYDKALESLSAQIADYYKTELKEPLPNAIYLSNLSSIYDRLTSQITANRYRVMIYVKKDHIKALGDPNSGVILSRDEADGYKVMPTAPSEPVVRTDTIETVRTVVKTLPPVLTTISQGRSRDEIVKELLPRLKKSNQISAAAIFPMADFGDFYLVVIAPNDSAKAILHFDGQGFTNALTGEAADVSQYSDWSAFWFTLPK